MKTFLSIMKSILKLIRNSFLKCCFLFWGDAKWCLADSRLPEVLVLWCWCSVIHTDDSSVNDGSVINGSASVCCGSHCVIYTALSSSAWTLAVHLLHYTAILYLFSTLLDKIILRKMLKLQRVQKWLFKVIVNSEWG